MRTVTPKKSKKAKKAKKQKKQKKQKRKVKEKEERKKNIFFGEPRARYLRKKGPQRAREDRNAERAAKTERTEKGTKRRIMEGKVG